MFNIIDMGKGKYRYVQELKSMSILLSKVNSMELLEDYRDLLSEEEACRDYVAIHKFEKHIGEDACWGDVCLF